MYWIRLDPVVWRVDDCALRRTRWDDSGIIISLALDVARCLPILRLFQSVSAVKLRHENPACTCVVAFGTLVLAEHLSLYHPESNFPRRAVT
jgi:hypothetical protein